MTEEEKRVKHKLPLDLLDGSFKVALGYLLIGGLWILISDYLTALLSTTPEAYARWQTCKGWGYVAVTTVLLYAALSIYTGRLKRARAQLNRVNRTLHLLNACDRAVIRATDEPTLLEDVCRLIVDIGGYRLAWVGVAGHDEAQAIRPAAQAGCEIVDLDTLDDTWGDEQGQGPTGTAIRTGEPAVTRHILTNPDFLPWREEAVRRGYASFIVLPLISRGQTVGVLTIYAEQPDTFDQEEIELLQTLADDLAFGIQVQRTRVEHHRAVETLQQHSELLNTMSRTAKIGAWEFDPVTLTGTWTEETARIHEVDLAHETNVEIGLSFYRGESRARIERAVQEAIEHGQPYDLELELLTAKGNHKWVRTLGQPIKKAGQVVKIQGTFQDITEHKRAEEALKESKASLARAQQIAHLGNWDWDVETQTLEWSDEVYRIFGVDEGFELTYEGIEAMIHPDDREANKQFVDALLTAASFAHIEFRIVRPDGAVRYIYQNAKVWRDEAGRARRVFGIMQDITERKQAEREVEQRNRELVALLNISQRLAGQLNVEEVLKTVARSSVDTLPAAEASSLWLYDGHSDQLVARAWVGHSDEAVSGLVVSPDTSLVGLVWQTRQPQIIEDVSKEPAFEPLGRPGLDAIRSVIGVPLVVEDQILGTLFADNYSRIRAFDEHDVRLLQSLANQAAIALKNAWLFEQVRAGRDRLKLLTRQVVSAQEEERRRISQELHDELGQAITAIVFDLMAIEKELPKNIPPTIEKRLAEAKSLANEVDERVSEIALDLRPSILDDLGLAPALRWYVNRYAQRLDMAIDMQVIGLEQRLSPEVETTLYRVVQEALTNVARHANASALQLRLERQGAKVGVYIEDNGEGFETERFPRSNTKRGGVGLLGIRERAALLGGTCDIHSQPGQGTRLTIEVPVLAT